MKIKQKILLCLLVLLGVKQIHSNPLAVPICATSYSVINSQGIVVTSGSTYNNQVYLGAICPGFSLVATIGGISPTPTSVGVYVNIGTPTPTTFTLNNPGLTITVPITVYNSTTTIPYSITVGPETPQYIADGCCEFTFNSYPLPDPAFLINPNPVCLGSNVCFSLTATQSSIATEIFGFYNGNITQSIYASLPSPDYTSIPVSCLSSNLFGLGTHTITATGAYNTYNGFCFNSVTHTFQVVPALSVPSIISSPSTAICISSTATLSANATGAVSYTWYPGGITGATIAITPTTNTTYTVIATNSNNCTNTATKEVQTILCCLAGSNVVNLSNVNIVAPGTSTLIWSNLLGGGNYSGNIAIPNSTYMISGSYNVIGNVNINTPVTFSNSDFSFAENVSINQNATVNINNSYWHGCDKNWQGILSGKYLSIKNSVIEDAFAAVQINASTITHPGVLIDNTIFNKNVYGIQITGPKLTSFKLTGSIFTSRDIPPANYVYSSGSRWTSLSNFNTTALSNYNTGFLKGSTILNLPNVAKGQVGIYLNNASMLITTGNLNGDITIGDASSTPTLNTSYTNIFDCLRIGTYNSNSRAILYNNWFQVINSIPASDLYGNNTACVYNNSTPRTIIGANISGSGAAIYKNNLTNSTNGVYATNNGTLQVYNNQFTNIAQYGVQIENWNCTNTQTVQINNNNFSTCLYDLYTFNNNTIKLTFANNSSTYPFVSSKAKVTYHVFINEINSPATAKYYIGYNNSTGKVNGVYCLNTYSMAIVNNNITVRTPIGAGFNAPIWLDNAHQGDIKYNTLSVNPTNLNSYYTFGIFTNFGNNNLYCENNITGAGSCMKFQGSSPSRIYRNNLNSNPTAPCLFGIFLDNYGMVGDIKYSTACAENIFGDFSNSDTYSQTGSLGSKIDYPGSFSSSNPYCPFNNSFSSSAPAATAFTANPNSLTGQATCISTPNLIGGGGEGMKLNSSNNDYPNLSAGIPIIMNDELNFSSNNANSKEIANKGTYEMARKSNLDISSITGGEAFMDANDANANGDFYKMDSLVVEFAVNGNTLALNQAKVLNSGIVAGTTIESNQKALNDIYHTFMQSPNLVTESQLNALKNLASLCPFTDGTSVYQARAIVKYYDTLVYVNSCEYSTIGSESKTINTPTKLNTSKEALNTLVYPNPANTEITVSTEVNGAKMIIFNVVGQILINKELNSFTKLDVSELKNGTYLYKIVKGSSIIKADKLIISE